MDHKAFRKMLVGEVGALVSSKFKIAINPTTVVPTVEDQNITYANFDAKEQKCKLIETCILYIDIRGSTDLNENHHRTTMAKLYSAFVRSMILGAELYSGKVRDIVGDRVMVVFDSKDCFASAVHTAWVLNTIAQHILNAQFPHDEVKCGIGIDYGKMLAAKTGVIKQGNENSAHKSLVWLGPPANLASKLTDQANKGGNPPILMTDTVYKGFAKACPTESYPKKRWWRRYKVDDVSYSGDIYGCDVVYLDIKD